MSISADTLRGHTDTIILTQLLRGDNYGYEINKKILELTGGAYGLKEATLYTAFKRLEQQGLILLGGRRPRRPPPVLRHHRSGPEGLGRRPAGVDQHPRPAGRPHLQL